MADQIKELIDKIHQEGVVAAQEKAVKIERESQQQAEMILEKANAQAQKILEEAEDRIERMQENSQATLKQSARDLLLSLRKEVDAMLGRLIVKEIAGALTAQELCGILASLIKERGAVTHDQGVIVYLKEEDKHKLESHFLDKLKHDLKKGLELRNQDDIQAGFIISFDSGKSHFDFSDKALAQYLISHLKPKVAQLFKDIK
jgi:V/A-type H+-transporting ATPase subunit E